MKMPSFFIGHGSPMNAIMENKWTDSWKRIGRTYRPRGILMVSAHWYTDGRFVQSDGSPVKINDMYGFPEELYETAYPVKGSADLTSSILNVLDDVAVDDSWGIDHGTWSVLIHMYPDADIPVVQLSVDHSSVPEEHFEAGRKLRHLRDEGFMIIGSGNVVHNLRLMNPSLGQPFKWSVDFDDYIQMAVETGDYKKCIKYQEAGDSAGLAVPMPDHYYPLLTVLGAVGNSDNVKVFNKDYDLGSISMTSYEFY